MTATGRVTVDAVARGRIAQECVQGFEIVGKTPKLVTYSLYFSIFTHCKYIIFLYLTIVFK